MPNVKLNEIVAVEKGKKQRTLGLLTTLYHSIHRPEPLNGLSRTYTPKDDGGDKLPDESKNVQYTVKEKLDEIKSHLASYWDVVLTKDSGNMVAKGDVILNGETVLEGVPVPHLIFLEKQLTDFRTALSAIPTLDPAEKWTLDQQSGLYRTDPVETVKTQKINDFTVVVQPTEHHPADVRPISKDVAVGTWKNIKLSGAIPLSTKNNMIEKANQLIDAVKSARERANSVDVPQLQAGEKLLDLILS